MLPLSPFPSKPPSSPPKPSSSSKNPSSPSSLPLINENPSSPSSQNPTKPSTPIISLFEKGSSSSSPPINENPTKPSIQTISSSSPGTVVLDNIIIPDHENHLNPPIDVDLIHLDLELVHQDIPPDPPDDHGVAIPEIPPDPDDHGVAIPLPNFNLVRIARQELKKKIQAEERKEMAMAKAYESESLKEIEELAQELYQDENPELFVVDTSDDRDEDNPVPATSCNQCPRTFTKVAIRREHQKIHIGFDFECKKDYCGCIFRTEKREESHCAKHH